MKSSKRHFYALAYHSGLKGPLYCVRIDSDFRVPSNWVITITFEKLSYICNPQTEHLGKEIGIIVFVYKREFVQTMQVLVYHQI